MALPATAHTPADAHAGQISFGSVAYGQLEALAAAKGMTVPEYVRAALGLAQWIDATLAEGGSVVVRAPGRPARVLHAPR